MSHDYLRDPMERRSFVERCARYAFGLTILPDRLREIREERRPGSKYASIDNCRYEVREAEHLMERERIPVLDTTTKSIEEIATTVLHRAKLQRRAY